MRRRRRSIGALATAILLAIVGLSTALADGHANVFVAFDHTHSRLPEGVAVDGAGNVFASLTTLGEVVKIPAGTNRAEPFGAVPGLAPGELGPIGLAVDSEGNVYGGVASADLMLNGVWRFDAASGSAERLPGSHRIGFANDIAIAQDGTMYITDTIAGSLWRAQPGGIPELWLHDELLEGTGDAGAGFPLGANGVAINDDTVYVAVTERAHVVGVPVNEDGSPGQPAVYAELPDAVDGIAFDAGGNLISAHPFADRITRRDADGELETIAQRVDGLDRPSTVALRTDPDGSTTVLVSNFSIGMGTELGHGPSILALELDGDEAPGDETTVAIDAGDVWFGPSESSIPADGTTRFALHGEGQVLHNLVIDELGVLLAVAPGETAETTVVDPPPGTYQFYCSVFGHARAGMVGTLVVE